MLDYKAIKQAVNWPSLLTYYKVTVRASPNTLRGPCPLPQHSNPKDNDSFIVTLKTEKAINGCYVCHSSSCVKARDNKKGGDALTFVSLMEKCTIPQAAQKLSEIFPVITNGAVPTHPATQPTQTPPPEVPMRNPPLKEKFPGFTCLKNLQPDHDQIRKRGITPETAQLFGAGFFTGKGSMTNRYVIPVHNPDGELVAYIGRGDDPKWKIPAGLAMHLELFNIHRVKGKDTVIVVEGAFDAMKLTQCGYNAVALIGTSVSEEQAALIGMNFDRAILMLDGDSAGREATDKALVKLASRDTWVKAVALPDGLDPDMLPVEQLKSLLGL